MPTIRRSLVVASAVLGLVSAPPALADLFTFSTGNPDGRLGTASRPGTAGTLEIESADDFVTTTTTSITRASFFGLLPAGTAMTDVDSITVEIYRVFPNDSDVGLTSGPPTFSTPAVPTRVNSPSDVEFDDRSTTSGNLIFNCSLVSSSFTVANTVVNGINPKPGQGRAEKDRRLKRRSSAASRSRPRSCCLPITTFSFHRSPSASPVISCGCRRRGRSSPPQLHSCRTCKAGFATRISRPTGCASAPTSSAEPPSTQLFPSSDRRCRNPVRFRCC